MKIYELTFAENFAIVDGKTENERFKFVLSSYVPKVDAWEMIELIVPKDGKNEFKKVGNITTTSAFPIIFDQFVVDELKTELDAAGILLPVLIKDSNIKYYYFHCKKEIDCLDLDSSNTMPSFSEPNNPHKLSAILKAKFFKGRVSANIFKVPQITYSHKVFFTEKIVEIIKKNGFTGVNFKFLD